MKRSRIWAVGDAVAHFPAPAESAWHHPVPRMQIFGAPIAVREFAGKKAAIPDNIPLNKLYTLVFKHLIPFLEDAFGFGKIREDFTD